VAAGRPTDGHAVLNFVDCGRCFVRRVTRRCHLKRKRYAGYVQKHFYILPRAALQFAFFYMQGK
jgi:hypothetical protein